MIKYLVLTSLIILSHFAVAQQQVTVVLKNGKVKQGILLDALYDDFITIEYGTFDRENIQLTKVHGIYFGEYKANEDKPEVKRPVFDRKRGFFHLSEVQYLMGQDTNDNTFANYTLFQTVNGFTFKHWLMTGLGVGIDKYGDFWMTPLFASVRGTIWSNRSSPYYHLNAGWSHFWHPDSNTIEYEEVRGGYHLQVGGGYQFNLDNSAITLGLGYRMQDSYSRYTLQRFDWQGLESNSFIEEKRLLRRVVLSLGYSF